MRLTVNRDGGVYSVSFVGFLLNDWLNHVMNMVMLLDLHLFTMVNNFLLDGGMHHLVLKTTTEQFISGSLFGTSLNALVNRRLILVRRLGSVTNGLVGKLGV